MHYEKYKSVSVAGLMMHCQRGINSPDTHHHSNETIDSSRTHLNYDLKCRDGSISAYDYYKKNFGDLADEIKRDTGKSVRKDAVALCSWVVTAPQTLPPEKYEDFFRGCYGFFAARYGDENIVAGAVHMDETTPHIHIAFIPAVERDGRRRLCAKDLETPKSLARAHTELQAHLTDMLGCTVELLTGETAAKGNRTVAELKMDAVRRESAALDAERERLQQHMEKYKGSVQELKQLHKMTSEEHPLLGDDYVRMPPSAYRRLWTLAQVGLEREAECERLTAENSALREQTRTAEREVETRFRKALAAADERVGAERKNVDALRGELGELQQLQHVLDFYPDELARMYAETATARAMERAYDTWRDDESESRGRDRDTCIPFHDSRLPRDVFFQMYLAECRAQSFEPRTDIAEQAAFPTSAAIAAVAARLVQHRVAFAKGDIDSAASRAAQQTAREMGAVLSYIGVSEKNHARACRACAEEMDRQGMGKAPREISSVGATVDFAEAAKSADADIQAAREVIPQLSIPLEGGGIYEKLRYITDPETRRQLLAKLERDREL